LRKFVIDDDDVTIFEGFSDGFSEDDVVIYGFDDGDGDIGRHGESLSGGCELLSDGEGVVRGNERESEMFAVGAFEQSIFALPPADDGNDAICVIDEDDAAPVFIDACDSACECIFGEHGMSDFDALSGTDIDEEGTGEDAACIGEDAGGDVGRGVFSWEVEKFSQGTIFFFEVIGVIFEVS
jgi:hypothetical protein